MYKKHKQYAKQGHAYLETYPRSSSMEVISTAVHLFGEAQVETKMESVNFKRNLVYRSEQQWVLKAMQFLKPTAR